MYVMVARASPLPLLFSHTAPHQDHDGARANRILTLLRQGCFGAKLSDIVWRSLHGVNEATPATPGEMRQLEGIRLPVRVGDKVNILRLLSLSPVQWKRASRGKATVASSAPGVKMHSVTEVAYRLAIAKLTPPSRRVAPSGNGWPRCSLT